MPAPGRRKAEAEGASLIGVPTVGVEGSPPRGVPWRGTTSSTLMRDDDANTLEVGEVFMASGLDAMNSGDWAVLRRRDGPRSASAWE